MLVQRERTLNQSLRHDPCRHARTKQVLHVTFAGVCGSAVVETSHTALTVSSPRVIHTLQTFTTVAITASRHEDVDVAVTLAGSAGPLHAGLSCRVTIETLLTDVTARTWRVIKTRFCTVDTCRGAKTFYYPDT